MAEWLGIKKALNSVGSLSCVNLDSQLKVCRHTHTSFLAHQCLSIVFLDESQTKGRRNRKEKKKQISGNTKGIDQNDTNEKKGTAKQVCFSVMHD